MYDGAIMQRQNALSPNDIFFAKASTPGATSVTTASSPAGSLPHSNSMLSPIVSPNEAFFSRGGPVLTSPAPVPSSAAFPTAFEEPPRKPVVNGPSVRSMSKAMQPIYRTASGNQKTLPKNRSEQELVSSARHASAATLKSPGAVATRALASAVMPVTAAASPLSGQHTARHLIGKSSVASMVAKSNPELAMPTPGTLSAMRSIVGADLSRQPSRTARTHSAERPSHLAIPLPDHLPKGGNGRSDLSDLDLEDDFGAAMIQASIEVGFEGEEEDESGGGGGGSFHTSSFAAPALKSRSRSQRSVPLTSRGSVVAGDVRSAEWAGVVVSGNVGVPTPGASTVASAATVGSAGGWAGSTFSTGGLVPPIGPSSATVVRRSQPLPEPKSPLGSPPANPYSVPISSSAMGKAHSPGGGRDEGALAMSALASPGGAAGTIRTAVSPPGAGLMMEGASSVVSGRGGGAGTVTSASSGGSRTVHSAVLPPFSALSPEGAGSVGAGSVFSDKEAVSPSDPPGRKRRKSIAEKIGNFVGIGKKSKRSKSGDRSSGEDVKDGSASLSPKGGAAAGVAAAASVLGAVGGEGLHGTSRADAIAAAAAKAPCVGNHDHDDPATTCAGPPSAQNVVSRVDSGLAGHQVNPFTKAAPTSSVAPSAEGIAAPAPIPPPAAAAGGAGPGPAFSITPPSRKPTHLALPTAGRAAELSTPRGNVSALAASFTSPFSAKTAAGAGGWQGGSASTATASPRVGATAVTPRGATGTVSTALADASKSSDLGASFHGAFVGTPLKGEKPRFDSPLGVQGGGGMCTASSASLRNPYNSSMHSPMNPAGSGGGGVLDFGASVDGAMGTRAVGQMGGAFFGPFGSSASSSGGSLGTGSPRGSGRMLQRGAMAAASGPFGSGRGGFGGGGGGALMGAMGASSSALGALMGHPWGVGSNRSSGRNFFDQSHTVGLPQTSHLAQFVVSKKQDGAAKRKAAPAREGAPSGAAFGWGAAGGPGVALEGVFAPTTAALPGAGEERGRSVPSTPPPKAMRGDASDADVTPLGTEADADRKETREEKEARRVKRRAEKDAAREAKRSKGRKTASEPSSEDEGHREQRKRRSSRRNSLAPAGDGDGEDPEPLQAGSDHAARLEAMLGAIRPDDATRKAAAGSSTLGGGGGGSGDARVLVPPSAAANLQASFSQPFTPSKAPPSGFGGPPAPPAHLTMDNLLAASSGALPAHSALEHASSSFGHHRGHMPGRPPPQPPGFPHHNAGVPLAYNAHGLMESSTYSLRSGGFGTPRRY